LIRGASTPFQFVIPVGHCLGTRPGEITHLRWLIDVIPLSEGAGFEVIIQARPPDERCSCVLCGSPDGWAPKNGPRRYFLEPAHDGIAWVAEAVEALNTWIALTRPQRGDYLFPSPRNRNRAMSNAELNEGIRVAGETVGIAVGMSTPGRQTAHSLRHSCASEMLERGVSHERAASWIGDTLQEFMKTYGRPDPHQMARLTLKGGPMDK
jgi:hypothetical protein